MFCKKTNMWYTINWERRHYFMFNQLYVQTEYSLLQSSCKIMPLVNRLKEEKVNGFLRKNFMK